MHIRLVLVCLALASPTAAQQIYKCADGEQLSYQSEPCANQPLASWDASLLSPPSDTRVHSKRANERILPVSRGTNTDRRIIAGDRQTRSAVVRRKDPCKQARAQRALAYERAGLKRSFQLSSRWDNRVQQACAGS